MTALTEFDGLPAHMRTDKNAYLFIRNRMIQMPVRSGDTKRQVNEHTPGAFKEGRGWWIKAERRFYHHPNGVFRCPVGWLISRELYLAKAPEAWQMKPGKTDTWGKIIEGLDGESIYSPHVKEAIRLSWGSLPPVDMLYELQTLHDDYLPVNWGAHVDAIGAFRRYI